MANEAQITLYRERETSDYVRFGEQPYPSPPNVPALGNVRVSKELLDHLGLGAELPDAIVVSIVAAS